MRSRVAYPLGVIPVRLGSTRFPSKPLAQILKKPMIQYVWEAASRSQKLADLVIATDSPEIQRVAEGFGAFAVLTPMTCATGTERVAWVAREAGGSAEGIILNIQGDEPLVSARDIDRLIESLEKDETAQMATLAVRKQDEEAFNNRNVVKVVTSREGHALYFSRTPLASHSDHSFLKHIGIYAFRQQALLRFCELEASALEQAESLEQLRALENGIRIKVVETTNDTIGVDVPEDILAVESVLKANFAGMEVIAP